MAAFKARRVERLKNVIDFACAKVADKEDIIAARDATIRTLEGRVRELRAALEAARCAAEEKMDETQVVSTAASFCHAYVRFNDAMWRSATSRRRSHMMYVSCFRVLSPGTCV